MNLNEGKACDAILRHLEGQNDAARSNMRWPEEEGHSAPVELVCNIGTQLAGHLLNSATRPCSVALFGHTK
jgi:hypothetical protein